MTKKDIETLAINAVRDSIVLSDFIDQFIADNDKEPSWDGHVYIYNDKSKAKAAFYGRVPVQVKGTEKNNFSKEEISFSVDLVDIRNYSCDGGTIFFVVYISSDGLQKKIYYIELSPVFIQRIIKDFGNQKSRALRFRAFPNDGNEKASIFRNFYDNCEKQRSFSNTKLNTVEELQRLGVFEGITASVSGYGLAPFDPVSAFLNSKIYFYAKIKGSVVPQPLDEEPTHLVFSEDINAIVTVNNIQYYNYLKRIRSKTHTTLRIGNSLSLVLSKNGNNSFTYRRSDKLDECIEDQAFFIAMYDYGSFNVNNIKVTINKDSFESGFDIEKEKKILSFVKKVRQVLDLLNAKGEVDLSKIPQADWKNMNHLICAFIDNQPVTGLRKDLPPVACMDFGNFKFALTFTPQETTETYIIQDFFEAETHFYSEDTEGEKHAVPSCCILRTDDLLSVTNIKIDNFLASFQEYNTPFVHERANWMLLDLLSAYDKTEKNKAQYLSTAEAFAEWLMDVGEDVLNKEILILNLYQVYKRERGLTSDEIRNLCIMTETNNQSENILVGAYLLLDNQVAAEMHFDRLEPVQQEEFRTYPICRFWTKKLEEA